MRIREDYKGVTLVARLPSHITPEFETEIRGWMRVCIMAFSEVVPESVQEALKFEHVKETVSLEDGE